MTDTPDPAVSHVLKALRTQLGHLESLVEPELHAAEAAERHLGPAWRRATAGENRLPVAAIVAVAIGLQIALPAHLNLGPTGLLPALEGALLVGLVAANPRHIDRTSTALRVASVALIVVISVANAWASGALVTGLVNGTEGENAGRLLIAGSSIYLTNVIVFSLWFWEWDRGGPVARAKALRPHPDFLFPQMAQPDLAPRNWTPKYFDYLYTSFTNATAFSPTDTMPLAIWAKMLMLLQSAISLVTVALVVARAVNILK